MNTNYRNYDKFPTISASGQIFDGYDAIRKMIADSPARVVVLDCYPVVDRDELIRHLGSLFAHIFVSDTCAYQGDELTARMQKNLTNDRIFGVMTTDRLADYFIEEKIQDMRRAIEKVEGRVLIVGVGAMLISRSGLNIHASLARWESQMRFRKGAPNWNCDNDDMDPLTKFKRGYFVEWRLADKHKVAMHDKFHYYMDTNIPDHPKMVARQDYDNAMDEAVNRPFRVVPYFDPGVWGGQWMKEVCDLDRTQQNFAWCFDCVPEENSVLYDFGGVRMEMPAQDLVFHRPKQLLGERVQARYGNEFPIRFDFLDTMGGGNLSLQVHPTTQYIFENFNMRYTQDESYYILDCGEDACVYLGAKTGADPQEFIDSLNRAQQTGEMDVERFVNKWPAKKHDHFLIPAGTLHCSGANTMVLEISSTPYIFTFKLWDWGRLGLDGKPRPINIEHGKNVIEFDRDTEWVKENLINQVQVLGEHDGVTEEKTGLHIFEPIETRRYRFTSPTLHKANGSVCVLNLVEGEEAEVVSPTNAFQPYVVHYAETFIVPAGAGDFILRPTAKSTGTLLSAVKAFIR